MTIMLIVIIIITITIQYRKAAIRTAVHTDCTLVRVLNANNTVILACNPVN